MNTERTIIVAITGASGSLYAKELMKFLGKRSSLRMYVAVSDAGRIVYEIETGNSIERDVPENAELFSEKDFSAPFISGSCPFDAMVIVPCSMATLAAVAQGTGQNIIHRGADVCLKERRKLILVPRETPLSVVHLRNMLICAEIGAVVLPAMPGFYHHPRSVNDVVKFIVARILDHLEISHQMVAAWNPTVSV